MQLLNFGLHITALIVILGWSDYRQEDLITIVSCLLLNGTITALSINRMKSIGLLPIKGIVTCTILFYWSAYLSKLVLAIFIADTFWVVPQLISKNRLLEELPNAFLVFTIGYASLIVGELALAPKKCIDECFAPVHPRYLFTFVAIFGGLLIKYYLKQTFLLDVPGEKPISTGIPMLSGALALAIGSGFLFFCNMLLFSALADNKLYYSLLGLFLAFANALVDLRFGSKDTIVYQVALTGIYLYMIRRNTKNGHRPNTGILRWFSVFLVFVGGVVLSSYRYMNDYRNAIRSGASVAGAINDALSSSHAAHKNSLVEIYNRITGLETLSAVISLKDQLVSDVDGFQVFGTGVIDKLAYQLLGSSSVMTRFSVTYFGQLYVTLGYFGLVVGCFLLGGTFMIAQRYANSLKVNGAMKFAFAPVLWILLVQALLGGGNLVMAAKEVVVVLAGYGLFARIAFPKATAARTTRYSSRRLPKRGKGTSANAEQSWQRLIESAPMRAHASKALRIRRGETLPISTPPGRE